MVTAVHRYGYCGLVLESAAALPLLPGAPGDRPADVALSFGPLPEPAADCVRAKPHFHVYADGSCVLRSPQGIRFRLDRGRSLRVEVPDGVDRQTLQTWLLGPGLGMLLHQRGTPPLHASAIAVGSAAVAIAGDSGAGKSTTARALLERGHRLLSDDQVVVDPATLLLHPSLPTLRLWAEAAEAFGDPTAEEARVTSGEDKFTIGLDARFEGRPRPLGAVVVLSGDPAEDGPVAERLSPGIAAAALHRHVFRVRLGTFMGQGSTIFRWATALAAAVPVYSLRRPRDLGRLDALAAYVEGLVAGGAA